MEHCPQQIQNSSCLKTAAAQRTARPFYMGWYINSIEPSEEPYTNYGSWYGLGTNCRFRYILEIGLREEEEPR